MCSSLLLIATVYFVYLSFFYARKLAQNGLIDATGHCCAFIN